MGAGYTQKKPQALWNLRPDQRRGEPRRRYRADGRQVRCQDLGADAAGVVVLGGLLAVPWWRMGACRLNRLRKPAARRRMGRGRRKVRMRRRVWRPWPSCGSAPPRGLAPGRACSCHLADQAALAAASAALAAASGVGAGSLASATEHRPPAHSASRDDRKICFMVRCVHTCAGWPAVVAAASP